SVLEADAHPAMPVLLAGVTLGRDGVGEDEEPGALAALLGEPLGHQVVFALEHRLEPLAAHVPPGRAVDGLRDGHVVRRDTLGDPARCPPDAEEPAAHLLPRADLRERAVLRPVEVDLDGLLMRVQPGTFHRSLAPSSQSSPSAARPTHTTATTDRSRANSP